MALLILALLQRIFLMSSLMLLLVWLIFFMVLIKLLPILGTISGKTVKLMVLALICLGNNRQDRHPPNCMFSCLQILEAFLWFVLITLLNVTLIILTLSVSRLLNLLLRLVAFLLFLNPQCLASISRWITASSSWKRFCLFVCRALSSIMVICMLTAIRLLLTFDEFVSVTEKLMDELAQCYNVLPQLDINNTIDHRPEGDEKWFLENEKTVT